jgi:F420-dependent oxidoreductase-like protein
MGLSGRARRQGGMAGNSSIAHAVIGRTIRRATTVHDDGPRRRRSLVKLGLHYWNYSTPSDPARIAPTLAEAARVAEQGGFSGLTVMDHWFQMDLPGNCSPDEPMLESYTTLGHVAALTERMTLGVLVTGVMYRHPGLLAKTVTTLDVLSGGRARLGIGASWYEREQVGLGVPVVPVAERFERLEETLQICLQMWGDNHGPFQGRHYQLAETLCAPAPLSQPHPPILVGGGGERKTLLLVARYADACNLFATSPEDVARKLDVLRSHCDAEGRDYDRIVKTVLAVVPALADVDGFVAAAGEYAALGVTEIEVMPDRHPVEFATQVAERVLPRLTDV